MNVRLLSSNPFLLQPGHIDMISIILLFITLVFGCTAAKKNIETTTEVPQQEQRCVPKSPEIIILESGHQGRHGEERSCYENGQIKTILSWEQDKIAESTNFHQNGIKSSSEKLNDGQFTGQRIWWYENGNKRFSAFYNEKGQKSGVEVWLSPFPIHSKKIFF